MGVASHLGFGFVVGYSFAYSLLDHLNADFSADLLVESLPIGESSILELKRVNFSAEMIRISLATGAYHALLMPSVEDAVPAAGIAVILLVRPAASGVMAAVLLVFMKALLIVSPNVRPHPCGDSQ